jgi:micrococcal nuclease
MKKNIYVFPVTIWLCLSLVLTSTTAFAEITITGKVVGVADGDTITVLQDRTQHKIRLYGIDCPESHQDFGNSAKQFVSNLVFGKNIIVIQDDIDRYSRIVGTVYINDLNVNQEIVRQGFAWVYPQYCKKPICRQWVELEAKAKNAKIGLWSHPNPTPPWEFRRSKHQSSTSPKKELDNNIAKTVNIYHGNAKSMVFHKFGCKYYDCRDCIIAFRDRESAIKAGYKPCGYCKP